MSYGIVCLTCRKYVRLPEMTPSTWYCDCAEPVLSADARTPLPKNVADEYMSGKRRAPSL